LATRAVRPFLPWLQAWEHAAAQRVTSFVGISREVQARIQHLYGRESALVYPPVRTGQLAPGGEPGDYFLIVSRLIPYKRIDLAVEAFNRLGLPLWIVGDGRNRQQLEAVAGPTIRFLGRIDEAEKTRLMASCRAFVFPGLEDFGIAPVEAMAAGRPVIAYAGGGALDSVVDGVTGLFFTEQTADSLVDAVRRFDDTAFDPDVIRAHAERFDERVFRDDLRNVVLRVMDQAGASRE
jgi:glycosyltransferase involved in cell wall biosynthesis